MKAMILSILCMAVGISSWIEAGEGVIENPELDKKCQKFMNRLLAKEQKYLALVSYLRFKETWEDRDENVELRALENHIEMKLPVLGIQRVLQVGRLDGGQKQALMEVISELDKRCLELRKEALEEGMKRAHKTRETIQKLEELLAEGKRIRDEINWRVPYVEAIHSCVAPNE